MVFISYARRDSDIALRLTLLLKERGVGVWIDQLDIPAGAHWDSTIESALNRSEHFVVILTQSAAASRNVMDEIAFALDENKKVIPLLMQHCPLPFRLRRFQYIDFTANYEQGIGQLLQALGENIDHVSAEGSSAAQELSFRQEAGPKVPAASSAHTPQRSSGLLTTVRRLLLLYQPATIKGWLWHTTFYCVILMCVGTLIAGLTLDGISAEFFVGLGGMFVVFGPPLLLLHFLARRTGRSQSSVGSGDSKALKQDGFDDGFESGPSAER